jgi:hypothetical protein
MNPNPFSRRELILWVLSHALVLPGMMQLVEFAFRADARRADTFVIFTIPTVIGLVQTMFLRRRVRHLWLWLPLTIAGLFLAFVLGLGWLFMLAMGFGFGFAQWPLLYVSRFRLPGLWIVCSGLGWISGAVADTWLAPILFGNSADHARYAFQFALFGSAYAIATGFYLHWCSTKDGSSPQVATDAPIG